MSLYIISRRVLREERGIDANVSLIFNEWEKKVKEGKTGSKIEKRHVIVIIFIYIRYWTSLFVEGKPLNCFGITSGYSDFE